MNELVATMTSQRNKAKNKTLHMNEVRNKHASGKKLRLIGKKKSDL